jgi:hypothetical protein
MAGNPEHERGRISCYALGQCRKRFEPVNDSVRSLEGEGMDLVKEA